jgi:hypothetical protein
MRMGTLSRANAVATKTGMSRKARGGWMGIPCYGRSMKGNSVTRKEHPQDETVGGSTSKLT